MIGGYKDLLHPRFEVVEFVSKIRVVGVKSP